MSVVMYQRGVVLYQARGVNSGTCLRSCIVSSRLSYTKNWVSRGDIGLRA